MGMADQEIKVALVTGANRGIGLETARLLAQAGFTVLMGSRDLARGQESAAQLQAEGLSAEAVKLDLTHESEFSTLATTLAERFGKLDVLVNNAGILAHGDGLPSIASSEALRHTFETNFFGLITLTQMLLPLLRKSPAGRIVNLSSILGSLGVLSSPNNGVSDSFKLLGYNASKTALNTFTVLLADELRDTPIKVNSAHPGWVKTEMGGHGAPLEVLDGARTSFRLATLPPDGPSGGFFHLEETLPW
jgi:NAD(P)-dependent dehydrogenase (short-subunit alcohol dehydrogenase family)